jgi:hypothetical protein
MGVSFLSKPAEGKVVKEGPNSYRIFVTQEHMCGLQGYNPMLGDSCPACTEADTLLREFKERENTLITLQIPVSFSKADVLNPNWLALREALLNNARQSLEYAINQSIAAKGWTQ